MPAITLNVNGSARTFNVRDPDKPLLYAIRNDLGPKGAKYGCGLGQCGAGEAATAPVAAALANAVFDATGVGLRRVPFTAPRVKAAMTETVTKNG